MAMQDAVLARLLVDDETKIGFMSFQRNAERARKTSQAFRDQGINNIVEGLDKQVRALRSSAKELSIFEASTYGANQAQIDKISKIYDDIDALKAQKAQQELAVREQEEAAQATQNLNNAIARKIHKLREEAILTGKTEDEIERYKLQQMGATKAQIEAVMAQRMATRAAVGHTKAQMNLNRGLRLMSGGFGQVGHQIQDIAVQLQMGQNALLVFGQQGSQIVSLFGGRGAMVGAFLAVGAALGTYLMPSIFKTTDHLKELEEAARKVADVMKLDMGSGIGVLTDDIIDLAQHSEELARRKLQGALVTAMLEVESATLGAQEQIEQFDKRTGAGVLVPAELGQLKMEFGLASESAKALALAAADVANGVDGSIESFTKLINETKHSENATIEQKKAFNLIKVALNDLEVESVKNQVAIEALTKLQENFNDALEEGSEGFKEAIEAQKEYADALSGTINALEVELAKLEQGEDAAMRLKLANQGLEQSDIDLVMAIQARINAAKEENDALDKQLRKEKELADEKENFSRSVVEQAANIGKSSLEMLSARAAALGLTEVLKTAFDELDAAAAGKKREKSVGDIDSLRQSLMTEEQALFDSYVRRNQIVAEALGNDAISTDAAYALQLQLLEDFEQKKKELREKSNKFEDKTRSQQTQMVMDDLGEMFQGISANNKKLFAISKAYNIAQAIMSTYTGAAKAIETYPPPLSFAMAAAQVAAGLGHVAQIRQQSFDGGGFTGMGSRSGGVDGKGGFPAILHPNETVIDHTKGQQQGITIVNNVDARGSGQDVDMKIQQAMQVTSQQTIATVQDLMRRRRM